MEGPTTVYRYLTFAYYYLGRNRLLRDNGPCIEVSLETPLISPNVERVSMARYGLPVLCANVFVSLKWIVYLVHHSLRDPPVNKSTYIGPTSGGAREWYLQRRLDFGFRPCEGAHQRPADSAAE